MKLLSPTAGYVAPLLPTLVTAPPSGDRWLHEVKHDGYRTLITIDGGRARTFTRSGHDWTDRYAPVAAAAEKLACRSAVIDGEMIVQDELGRSDFAGLRSAIAREPHRLVFFAFDLLHLDGLDLRPERLTDGRGTLRDLLAPAVSATSPLQFSDDFDGDGADLFAAADRMGLEGIVSKRVDSRYTSGRSRTWLKCKCMTESELIVVGTDVDADKVRYALLARPEGNGISFAGQAIIALPFAERELLREGLARLAADRSALPELRRRKAEWVRPELKVKVRHLQGSGPLRHAIVRSIAGRL